jgi:tungstate transport system substrate-binding protein
MGRKCDRCSRRATGRGLFAFLLAVGLLVLGLPLGLPLGPSPASAEGRILRIAMTNAQKDSGLLDALLPEFVQQSGYSVRVAAREIGAIAVRARKGEADVVLSDSPETDAALEQAGVVTKRTPFMRSRFVVLGPKTDPAGVARLAKPEAALGQVLRLHSPLVSRGDDSTAHQRESVLLRAAGFDPGGRIDGLFRTGTSMRESLRTASQRRAYILADLGTWLPLASELDLAILSKPAKSYEIVHSILQLDSTRAGQPIELEGAKALEKYLTSPAVQARIAAFGRDRYGEAAFTPETE